MISTSMNRGSLLATWYLQEKFQDIQMEPVTRVMGIPPTSFKEFNKENIRGFNDIARNKPGVKV